MERYFSTGTVGKMLEKSSETIRLWCVEGTIAAGKPNGGHWRISETALIEFRKHFDPRLDSRRGGVGGRLVASQRGARRALILDTEPKESCLEGK